MKQWIILILFIGLVTALSFDEEFQALKDKISALEQKVDEDQNEKALLQTKVTALEIKMSNLVTKNEGELNSEQIDIINKIGFQINGRTCEELFKYGLKESGMQRIDPDGEDYGFPPITVYCDYESKYLFHYYFWNLKK